MGAGGGPQPESRCVRWPTCRVRAAPALGVLLDVCVRAGGCVQAGTHVHMCLRACDQGQVNMGLARGRG